MKSSEIKIGETYLFVATDSPTRKHLEGQPFEVTEKRRVWRRVKGKRANVYRFFDQLGHAARAEELELLTEFEKLGEDIRQIANGFGEAMEAARTLKLTALQKIRKQYTGNIQPSDYKNEDGLPF